MVREEVTKQVERLYLILLALGAGYWVSHEFGMQWLWVFAGGAVIALVWQSRREPLSPRYDKHRVPHYAVDICRLDQIREVDARGEEVWSVEERYGGKKEVVAMDGTHWDGWWKRVYETALGLEMANPIERDKRENAAAKQAMPVLEKGERLAKSVNGELAYWASGALRLARRR